MSKQGRINHVARALAQSKFYKGPPNPNCLNYEVEGALNKFLCCKKGKDVRRVVNALRNVSDQFCSMTTRSDCITPEIRKETLAFIERNQRVQSRAIPEEDMMQVWEKSGRGTLSTRKEAMSSVK